MQCRSDLQGLTAVRAWWRILGHIIDNDMVFRHVNQPPSSARDNACNICVCSLGLSQCRSLCSTPDHTKRRRKETDTIPSRRSAILFSSRASPILPHHGFLEAGVSNPSQAASIIGVVSMGRSRCVRCGVSCRRFADILDIGIEQQVQAAAYGNECTQRRQHSLSQPPSSDVGAFLRAVVCVIGDAADCDGSGNGAGSRRDDFSACRILATQGAGHALTPSFSRTYGLMRILRIADSRRIDALIGAGRPRDNLSSIRRS